MDPPAGGWTPLVTFCLAEVRDLVKVLGAGLPGSQASAKEGAPPAPAVKWNAPQLSSGGAAAATREADLAAWHLKARYQRTVWCTRALAGARGGGGRQGRAGGGGH
jgi:hypothetical protein